MSQFLRFPFAGSGHNADVSTVQTADEPFSADPDPDDPYPQSLAIEFDLADPQQPGPEVRPLIPGTLTFIPSYSASGITPDADADPFTTGAYSTWKVEGALMVNVADATAKRLPAPTADLPVVPNVLWYWPVVLTQDFLFKTLAGSSGPGLPRWVVGGATETATNHPDWAKRAVFAFLAGFTGPPLKADAQNPQQHDAVKFPMPRVKVTNGHVKLHVSAAAKRKPQDDKPEKLDSLGTNVFLTSAHHPRFGAIPARAVYRGWRSNLLDAPAGSSGAPTLADAVLREWPAERRYFPVRFTRTWKPIPNTSIHFPGSVARVLDQNDNLLAEQRLPAHGVLFVEQAAPSSGAAVPAAPTVKLAIDGPLRWLRGEQATGQPPPWKQKGGTVPLSYDLAQVPSPHVVVRRPFADEVLVEEMHTPGGPRCTYMTMRRFTRAFVDHRITGGRLNFAPEQTGSETQTLLNQALAGSGASPAALSNGKPLPGADLTAGPATLLSVLEAIFDETAPVESLDGAMTPDPGFKQGRVAYFLWQSGYELFEGNGTKRAFPSAHIGHGGPGAAVYLGLATYAVNIQRGAEAAVDYSDSVIAAMKAETLQPGAVLQMWNTVAGYDLLRTRSVGQNPSPGGHSPTFWDYERTGGGTVIGMRLVDQNPPQQPTLATFVDVAVNSGFRERLVWSGTPEVWFGANWTE